MPGFSNSLLDLTSHIECLTRNWLPFVITWVYSRFLGGVRDAHLSRFLVFFFICFIFFLCLVLNESFASVSELFILDCPSVFSNVYFVLCLVYSILPVSLGCSFLIAPSVFSNVYFVMCLVYSMLPVSLDCPFFITPSVFYNIYS